MRLRLNAPCCGLEVRASTDEEYGVSHSTVVEAFDLLHYRLCPDEQAKVKSVKTAPDEHVYGPDPDTDKRRPGSGPAMKTSSQKVRKTQSTKPL